MLMFAQQLRWLLPWLVTSSHHPDTCFSSRWIRTEGSFITILRYCAAVAAAVAASAGALALRAADLSQISSRRAISDFTSLPRMIFWAVLATSSVTPAISAESLFTQAKASTFVVSAFVV